MPWWMKYMKPMKMDTAGDGKGAGGGAGDGKGAGDAAAATAKELADLKAERDALKAERDTLKGAAGKGGGSGDEGDLAAKAQKEREAAEAKARESGQMESALSFNLQAKTWLKTNETLLPKSVASIFEAAEKENYGSAMEKANAIKVGVVQEFFAQDANYQLLTPGLKSKLEDFKKLVKNVKNERVQEIYDTVFEPTLEMMRQIKKAEQVRRGGADATDSESAHIAKMTKASRKHFMKENG